MIHLIGHDGSAPARPGPEDSGQVSYLLRLLLHEFYRSYTDDAGLKVSA